jgi:hypothetical protein
MSGWRVLFAMVVTLMPGQASAAEDFQLEAPDLERG